MKDSVATALALLLLGGPVIAASIWLNNDLSARHKRCAAKGGVLVDTAYGAVCIKAERLTDTSSAAP